MGYFYSGGRMRVNTCLSSLYKKKTLATSYHPRFGTKLPEIRVVCFAVTARQNPPLYDHSCPFPPLRYTRDGKKKHPIIYHRCHSIRFACLCARCCSKKRSASSHSALSSCGHMCNMRSKPWSPRTDHRVGVFLAPPPYIHDLFLSRM